ncbi:MAG: YgfZ/GcvT domain-containing protein [Ilumatobacteraceae bacterium]
MFWCRTSRDALSASGRDAASYLQSQLSQDLRPMAVGASAWSFVLTPTGKVEALVRVRRVGDDEYLLDTDEGRGAHLLARLLRFRIRVDVDVVATTLDVVAVRGEGMPPTPADALVAWGSGFDLVAGTASAAEICAVVPQGDADDLLAARIESCWPAAAELVPGETVPAETGVVDVAVSFTKGCYPGQELVERMDSRGSSAPWRLATIDVAPGTLVGDPVVRDGVDVGVVTSALGTRAIARLRRSAG